MHEQSNKDPEKEILKKTERPRYKMVIFIVLSEGTTSSRTTRRARAMNNEHLAAQSDIKNPRELKPPGREAEKNASHDPVTTPDPSASHSDPAYPKKIFVCSPYRPLSETEESRKAELESNIHRAKTACRILTALGFMPMAPHLYFTTFLKDEEKRERENGIRLGLRWLEEADEVWVFGDTISEGMAVEIARAKELAKPVRNLPEPSRMVELLIKGISAGYKGAAQRCRK